MKWKRQVEQHWVEFPELFAYLHDANQAMGRAQVCEREGDLGGAKLYLWQLDEALENIEKQVNIEINALRATSDGVF